MKAKPRKCNCDFCQLHTRIKYEMRRGSLKSLRTMVDELSNRLWHTEADLNYCNAILDGSWPTAVDQLGSALEKAKEVADTRSKETR